MDNVIGGSVYIFFAISICKLFGVDARGSPVLTSSSSVHILLLLSLLFSVVDYTSAVLDMY